MNAARWCERQELLFASVTCFFELSTAHKHYVLVLSCNKTKHRLNKHILLCGKWLYLYSHLSHFPLLIHTSSTQGQGDARTENKYRVIVCDSNFWLRQAILCAGVNFYNYKMANSCQFCDYLAPLCMSWWYSWKNLFCGGFEAACTWCDTWLLVFVVCW